MLLELAVENLAVVERLRVRFHAGLNALTGETGSGKSLVVDALALLFGGRASADVIRSGADRAFVSGIFEAPAAAEFTRILEEAGIAAENGELLIEREILAEGKSRAYVSNRPVTAALLKQLAPYLGDIHGQHDQQKLFSPEAQLELLDEAAGAPALLEETASAWASWQDAARELAELNRAEQEKLRMADLWTMQRKEIEAVSPREGEDAALENERRVLGNISRLSESAAAAYEALSEAEQSASKNLAVAVRRLEEICRIDSSLQPVLEALRPAQIAVNDAAHELRHYLGGLEADPARLEQVESRLAAIERLKRKYGNSIEEILAFLSQVSAQLDAVETAGERRRQLEEAIAARKEKFFDCAHALRSARQKAAARLSRQVEAELGGLAMKGSVFRIVLRDGPPGPSGIDAVEFLFSANAGEAPRPLDRVASGGELSRVALALRTCISARPGNSSASRTLVFDEVDSGIGGAAAETVGRRLKRIARHDQVLCVTHLPQIAGFADHHFEVSKREASGRTVAEVRELDAESRIREIGRMLSGHRLTGEALRHAERLLEECSRAAV
jgi:DNA repair protein RecN (Recombination protein N)